MPGRDKDSPTLRKLLLKTYKYLLIAVIPVAVLLAVIFMYQLRVLKTGIMEQNIAIGEKCAYIMDAALMEIVSATYVVSCDPATTILYRTDREHLSSRLIENLGDVQTLIFQETTHSDMIDFMLVVYPDISYFVTANSGWRYDSEQYEIGVTPMTSILRGIAVSEVENGWQISEYGLCYMYNIIYNASSVGKVIAILYDSALTNAMCLTLPENGARLLLLDETGAVLADSQGATRGLALDAAFPLCPMQDDLFTYEGNTYSATWIDSSISQWQYVLTMPRGDYTDTKRATLISAMLISLLTLLVSVIILYYISRRVCRPYDMILELLNYYPVEISSDSYELNYKPYDELGMIAKLIYQKNYRYLAVRDELSEKQRMLRDAQRAALQAQMNPHFLYNALESINWLAIRKLSESNEVSDMISRLANLMRATLATDEPMTTVAKEVEHACLYLEFQKMRFREQFQVEWDIQPDTLDCPAVRLSLQPLIENAIKHGVLNVPNGWIRISCIREGANIIFAVSDNGCGITTEKLRELQSLMEETKLRAESVGLVNLNTRLRLIFGDEYHLIIESEPMVMTCVIMTIPVDPVHKMSAEG